MNTKPVGGHVGIPYVTKKKIKKIKVPMGTKPVIYDGKAHYEDGSVYLINQKSFVRLTIKRHEREHHNTKNHGVRRRLAAKAAKEKAEYENHH